MIKVIFGAEDYCVWFKKHKIIDTIQNQEFNLKEFECFDEDTLEWCRTFPMLSDRRAAVLCVPDLKILDTKLFKGYMAEPAEETDVVILPDKVDKKTKFYKSLLTDQIIEEHPKLKSVADLQKMILVFLKNTGAQIKQDACEELIRRLNYFERDEVNLWTVKNAVQNLAQSSLQIDKALVETVIEDNEKENVFLLIDLLKKGNLAGIAKQENLIMRAQGSTHGALSAMLREFRIAYKQKFLGAKPADIGVKFISLNSWDAEKVMNGLEILTDTIFMIKSGRLKADRAISYACEKMLVQ